MLQRKIKQFKEKDDKELLFSKRPLKNVSMTRKTKNLSERKNTLGQSWSWQSTGAKDLGWALAWHIWGMVPEAHVEGVGGVWRERRTESGLTTAGGLEAPVSA